MTSFNSQADQIRYYTRELLADKKEHNVQEIKDYVKNQTQKNFSPGAYAGAIRDLVAKEDGYENPKRGVYIFSEVSNQDDMNLIDTTKIILEKGINELYSEIGKKNIFTIQEDDLKTINKIKEIIKYLKTTIKDL
ncbi:hypothetical protein ABEV54_11715 [Peribacillus psychrosaccharolyticus]|uniref:hypothetical protein n=1 Tax=Peribacillus psychrosaccharolyticus TaxID=1407 RepID=UPI003D29F923